MLLPYFASKEDDPESQPSGLTVLLKHKPLLVLALALAVFHLGNAAIVPLFRMSAVSATKQWPKFRRDHHRHRSGRHGRRFRCRHAGRGEAKLPANPAGLLPGLAAPRPRGFLPLRLVGVTPVEILDGIGVGL
jgi:hypothetical protein